jgi:hypothetical protein
MTIEQNNICETFNNFVTNALPNAYVNARVQKLIGQETIVIAFAGAKTWPSNIMQNDPAFMQFIVFVNSDGSADIEAPTMHSSKLRKAGLKFRKIAKENEAAAMAHLTRWFIKNRDIINSVM